MESIPYFNIYSSKLQKIPTPKFICFYNGTECASAKEVLKLSDAYDGEGMVSGALNMLTDLVKDGILSIGIAAQKANMSVSEFELKTGLKTHQ